MPILFNSILVQHGIDPNNTALVRHSSGGAQPGREPQTLWYQDRAAFNIYQKHQALNDGRFVNKTHWAVFIATPKGGTLFVGVYTVASRELLTEDTLDPSRNIMMLAGEHDVYELIPDERFSDLSERLTVGWGNGWINFAQAAAPNDKPVLRLLANGEAATPFPGLAKIRMPLSELAHSPQAWVDHMCLGRGVYLLVCPRDGSRYVGSASGEDGFWQRWQDYIATGHGWNEHMVAREPSDYWVTVLWVAASDDSVSDICAVEQEWITKLDTRWPRGLN